MSQAGARSRAALDVEFLYHGSLAKKQNRHPAPPTKWVTIIGNPKPGTVQGKNMTTSPKTRDLARCLLNYEVVSAKSSESMESAALSVYEKLRQSLSAFAGVAAFETLAFRALTQAKSEAPGLWAVQVAEGGSLQGLGEFELQNGINKDLANEFPVGEGGIILIARLLGLLLIFLGEALTLSLLRNAWPGAALDDHNSGNGRKA